MSQIIGNFALATGVYAANNTSTLTTLVTGNTIPSFTLNADGTHAWGPGNGALDTSLYRDAPGVLRMGGTNPAYGNSGAFNVGVSGVYCYKDSNRWIRFNANGNYNDFKSNGAPLAMMWNAANGEDVYFFGDNAGDARIAIGKGGTPDAILGVYGKMPGVSVLNLHAASGQSNSIMAVFDVTGTATVGVEANGYFKWFSGSQTTIGAAGTAAALPSLPVEYLKINTPGGVRVIPAYNAI